MSEQPGRYNRSFEGLIGAIIIIVVVVLGFVVFRGVFSDAPEQDIPEVDYREQVLGLQSNGVDTVYPTDLPEGWRATEVRFEPGDSPRLELNFFTDGNDFVGLRLVDEEVEDLLEEAGLDRPVEEEPLVGVGDVAEQWDGWSDEDGDHAYSAEVGGATVLLYGSVSADVLADVVGRLSTEPLPTPGPSPSP